MDGAWVLDTQVGENSLCPWTPALNELVSEK